MKCLSSPFQGADWAHRLNVKNRSHDTVHTYCHPMVNSCYSLHVHKILASTSQRYDWGQKIEWSILTRTVTTHIRDGLLSLGLDFLRLAYLPNLKFLYQRITKIRKAIQNVENGVAWDSQETRSHSRSLEIAPLNRAHTTFGLPYAFILHHF